MEINNSCLLTLRGIYLDDIASSIVSWIQEKPSLEKVKTYTPLPKTFSSVATWPSTSNLCCWSCSRIPADYPRFIPINASFSVDGKPVCETLGNFDSWHCVIRYIEREMPRDQQWDLVKCTTIFAELFTGNKFDKIIAAPPKIRMEQYCGTDVGWTSDEFTKQLLLLDSIKKIQSL